MNGTLAGHALGKGGRLTVNTPYEVLVSDLPAEAGSVLDAGVKAPRELRLATDTRIVAGTRLLSDLFYNGTKDAGGQWMLPPDARLAQPAEADFSKRTVVTQADWVVPEGVYLYDEVYNYYEPGATIARGTQIVYSELALPAGFVAPSNVFPDGVPTGGTAHLVQPAGVLATALALPRGTRLPAGTTLQQSVEVVAPRVIGSAFFTQGGFSSYGLSGAWGLSVTSGTVVAPTTDKLVLSAPAHIASGARLASLATQPNSGVALVNSSALPEGQRSPMELILSTAPAEFAEDGASRPLHMTGASRNNIHWNTVATNPGKLSLDEGSAVRMEAGSRVLLDSLTDVFAGGTVSTPGGAIRIAPYGMAEDAETPLRVRIGEHAQLLAPGYQKSVMVNGDERRSLVAGGTIEIGSTAQSPWLMVGRGAVLDVSGSHGVVDLFHGTGNRLLGDRGTRPYVAREADGDAGAIDVFAQAGLIAGDLRLAPGGSSGRGGRLAVSTSALDGLLLRQSGAGIAEVGKGSDFSSPGLTIVADSINRSGLDELALATPGTSRGPVDAGIVFDGDVSLKARRSITLTTPQLQRSTAAGGNVEIAAAYVAWNGGTDGVVEIRPFAKDLNGSLTVRADLIDLVGYLQLGCSSCDPTEALPHGGGGGFGRTAFISSGDIRLVSGLSIGGEVPLPGTSTTGGIMSGGALSFSAAQVYAMSGQGVQFDRSDSDPGFLVRSGAAIEIVSNGAASPVPLAFGERLTLRAPVIEQAGVLRAPQGQIRLEASESLRLRPGSLTSASLEGATALYGFADGVTAQSAFMPYRAAGQTATKSVTLSGPTVDLAQGAVVDVSGGGDLLGLRFTGGNRGSQNLLAKAAGYFAVLPSLGNAPAPLGQNEGQYDPRLKVGDTVWLEAAPGLKAGYYTLLPAAYAALDGGMLVKPMSGVGGAGGAASTALPVAATARADGAMVVSGYRAVANTPVRDVAYGSFLLMDGKTWQQYSEIATTSFNRNVEEMAASARVPVRTAADAGSVVMAATQALNLDGTVRFDAGVGRQRGLLDISSPKIALTSDGASVPVPAGYLQVDAGKLGALGAGSILLGGMRPRTSSNDGKPADTKLAVTTTASDVLVAGGTRYTGAELLLTATGALTIGAGAMLVANDAAGKGSAIPLALSGDGAFLRLSPGASVDISRKGASGATGSLLIGENVVMRTPGSLSFDVTKDLVLADSALLDTASLDLAAVRINLGAVPKGTGGTTLGVSTVQRLASSTNLVLRGHESINFYGNFVLGSRDGGGNATLSALTLDTALLQGQGDDAHLAVRELTLKNSGDGVATTPAASGAGGGVFALDVDRLVFGPGIASLGGYAALTGRAGDVHLRGQGAFTVNGDIDLATGRVAAGSDIDASTGEVRMTSDHALRATGRLALRSGSVSPGHEALPAGTLGGKLTLSGGQALIDTRIAMNAGRLDIRAEGGNLALGAQAVLDVSGRAIDFRDVAKFAPGGELSLSATGDVDVAPGALLDVSGSARGGAAGGLQVNAGGHAALAGRMLGNASTGYGKGRFTLDALTTDFSALNTALNAGAFNKARDLRLRGQDIVLAMGERIDANQLALRADAGLVRIGGTIAAGGNEDRDTPDGGRVRLIGGNGVQLDGTARIEARAATAQAASGSVELVADGGRVSMAGGALVDVSGGREGGGRVMVRAARNGNGVAADTNATVQGAREQTLVGMQDYSATEIDAAMASRLLGDASAWLAGATPVAGWDVGAGMRVRSAGDLNVSSNIDLGGLQGAGYLGLVAAGDLRIDATLSDGFASAARDAVLDSGRSFSFEMDSGRDIRLAAGQMVRTGTGDLRINAGRDLLLADNAAVIYTAGARAATAAGFDGSLYSTSKLSPGDRVIGEFPTLGGDIVLSAGRDIAAPLVRQTTSAWLYRHGAASWSGVPEASQVIDQTSWSVVFRNFESGVGALGGGNVAVNAGRNIKDLAVAIPTTGHMTTPVGGHAGESDIVIRGGGNLDLRAAGDVQGGVFVLGRGRADVAAAGNVGAGGDITAVRRGQWEAPELRSLNPLFGLMDAQARVTAGGHLSIEAAFDPTMQGQVCENLVGNCSGNSNAEARGSAFYSNTPRTALNAVSLGGNLRYLDNAWASAEVSRTGKAEWRVLMELPNFFPHAPLSVLAGSRIAPGALSLVAATGDTTVQPFVVQRDFGLTLAASPTGTLELLANRNLSVNYGADISQSIRLLDIAAPYVRGMSAPMTTAGIYSYGVEPIETDALAVMGNNFYRGFTPLHAADTAPVRLVALSGSIGNTLNLADGWSLVSPKPVDVYAGRDILRSAVVAQNNNPRQVSRLVAGRDLLNPSVSILGEGELWLEAGRDFEMELKGSGSIRARGNMAERGGAPGAINLALPDRSADIHVIAGTAQGVDYDGFARRYLDPANLADPSVGLSNAANAGKVVHTYERELDEFLARQGIDGVTPANRLALLAALPAPTRNAFLQQVLIDELRATGIDCNDPGSKRYQQYTRGYDAMNRLFPAGGAPRAGDGSGGGRVALNSRLVETQSGSSITLLAPYGAVTIGDSVTEPGDARNGGVITRRGGDVQIVADRNIDLGISRVFTLGGGDILMWTSGGDITAGAGAKTSVTNVPLVYIMDRDGVVTVDSFGLSTGAGIGVLDAFTGTRERKKSRLDLLAFKGEVNAGDAGIRVLGDVNIAALRVVNADNIQVQGKTTGLATTAPVNIGALTDASAAASQAATAAQEVVKRERAAARQALPSVFTVRVRVLGFGNEPGAHGDEPSPGRPDASPRVDPRSAIQVLGDGALTPGQQALLTPAERRNWKP